MSPSVIELPSLDQIIRLSSIPEHQTNRTPVLNTENKGPLLQETHTQLYYTPIYDILTKAQKQTYNRLFGSFVIEQFMVFEEDFTNRILLSLLKIRKIIKHKKLSKSLRLMINEELLHSHIFSEYNSCLLPQKYPETGNPRKRFFSKMRWSDKVLFSDYRDKIRLFPGAVAEPLLSPDQ